jgi:tetratricopeptide (TPR) repeat protein
MKTRFPVVPVSLLFAGAAGADARSDAIQAFESRQDRAALAQLQAAVKAAPDDAELHDYLGRAWLRATQVEPAVAALTRAVELAPERSEYHRRLASALGQQFQQANVFRKAGIGLRVKRHMDRALELDPNSVEAREALLRFYAQVPGIAGGSMDKAREQAAAITRLSPADGPRLEATLARFDKKPEAEVVAAWQKAAAAPGATVDVGLEYGYYLQQLERWDAAFAQFDALAKAHPSSPVPTYQFGRTAVLSGQRLADGEQALKAYLESGPKGEDDPTREAAHWRLGNVLERAGRRDEARAQYQAALKENPDFQQAKDALDKLG